MNHIIKVEYMPAKHLLTAHLFPRKGVAVFPQFVPWAHLCTTNLSALESTSEIKDGVLTYTHRLTAILPERIPSSVPLAFRLTAADGRVFLLGSKDRPHPHVVQVDSAPGKTSERAANTLTATLVTRYPLMQIIGQPQKKVTK